MIDVELVMLLREHIQSILHKLQRELKDCHTGYLMVDRKDEDCFENTLKLFNYILDNDDIREVDRLKNWIDDIQSGMYINCVYCGHRYGPKDEVPESMADVLKKHIEECPKHPMSKLKKENDKLRKLVRAAYSEGFDDGMGNKSESETWDDSQSRQCLENGFEISDKNEN